MRDKAHSRMLHLNAFLSPMGHHEGGWRLEDSEPLRMADLQYYAALARTAEHAKFDAVFLACENAVSQNIRNHMATALDPLVLLSSLAGLTSRIGLIGTVSTSFNEPFNLARSFSTLDHLSRGRAGWNIVTSNTDQEARNFGLDDHLKHEDRYARAAEFIEITLGLWDSWEDAAMVADKGTGVLTVDERIHAIQHRGKYYKVTGPLSFPRPPQGYPVLVQAGASETGREFAASTAEVVFTAQSTLEDAQAYYRDVKERVERHGRDPDGVKILPGLSPILGETTGEAQELEEHLGSLITTESALRQMSWMLGYQFSEDELDGPLPALPSVEEFQGIQSRFQLLIELAEREHLTVRELAQRVASSRGHRVVVGTPEQVADDMELWFHEDAADGFNVMPAALPSGLNAFAEHVVPILQKRGLFRTEYEGVTLRDHLGLVRPPARTGTGS